MKRAPAFIGAAFVLMFTPAAAEDALLRELPAGWSVRSVEATVASREAVAQKLGVSLLRLENCPVTAGKTSFQLNLATTRDEAGARKLEEKFLALHGNDDSFVFRKGTVVAEITKAPGPMAARLKHLLACTPPAERQWRVRLEAVPVSATKNAMHYQPLFETLGKLVSGTADPAALEQLKKLRADFTFGDKLQLYALPGTAFATEGEAAADRFTLPSTAVQRRQGIPVVPVEFTMKVRGFSVIPGAAPDVKALTAATEAWPRNISAINDAAAGWKPLPPAQRLEKILAWVNTRVPYGGKVMGSRYGVAATLKQGYGRCWDASDAFIAACRAAGLPARQVGGWVVGLSGHVWAEVWLDDPDKEKTGWLPVDPSTSWTGVSVHYVPWWISDDGLKPLELWGLPRIERVK